MPPKAIFSPLCPFMLALALIALTTVGAWANINELRARGYVVMPAPQQVKLGTAEISLNPAWRIEAGQGVDRFTVQWLRRWADDLAGLRFAGGTGGGRIMLRVAPGAAASGIDSALARQGYLLTAGADSIAITGNSQQGLFYGVCTFVQLLRRDADSWQVPVCRIEDWPDLQLRFAHKDTKLHQERPETIKRHLDWLALMKVNCVAFDIDDRFEYPSHPVIGIPGAYTTAQMQEFTNHALQRHIQFVPDMQSPAHFNWALKHPQFAHLQADGNNYQACLCGPEALALIRDLYGDLIEATPGVEYFHMSMDEVYYAGICEKCGRSYNEEERSLAWAEYVNRQYEWLSDRGRKVLAWVEYPLLPKHVSLLPSGLIDGVLGNNPAFIESEREVGIRQLIYTSLQGVELLFPNYFTTTYIGNLVEGRLAEARQTILRGKELSPQAIGSFTAFWDASGPHEEAAWLGWATVNQYAWNSNGPGLDQHVEDFFDLFHGRSRPDMTEVYKVLIEQARFFESGWDRVPSITRGLAYGNSRGKGIGTQRYDYLLPPPGLPRPVSLELDSSFSESHSELVERARQMKTRNDHLRSVLIRWVANVERNRYSLEVFLAITRFSEYFIRTVLAMAEAELQIRRASESHAEENYQVAAERLVAAYQLVDSHQRWADKLWREFKEVWERSRYPKGRSVGGRNYVFIPNDTKDLWADRTSDMNFMIAPFERIGLDCWLDELAGRIKSYTGEHGLQLQLAEPERQDN